MTNLRHAMQLQNINIYIPLGSWNMRMTSSNCDSSHGLYGYDFLQAVNLTLLMTLGHKYKCKAFSQHDEMTSSRSATIAMHDAIKWDENLRK
jgi:hypothetical protein